MHRSFSKVDEHITAKLCTEENYKNKSVDEQTFLLTHTLLIKLVCKCKSYERVTNYTRVSCTKGTFTMYSAFITAYSSQGA